MRTADPSANGRRVAAICGSNCHQRGVYRLAAPGAIPCFAALFTSAEQDCALHALADIRSVTLPTMLSCSLIIVISHTHPFNGTLSGSTQVSRYQKGKSIWILLEQETVSGNGISWAICKSTPRSTQITTPAPHYSVFLQAGCPFCRPTNSVKALKALSTEGTIVIIVKIVIIVISPD